VARQTQSTDADDAVPLKPEDLRVVLPVPHSLTACAGAAAGFVMRRIAYRAGAYAPGIQEFLFHDLTTVAGQSVESVHSWLSVCGGQLHGMGYRISGRRVMGEKTEAIIGWVREGQGYRGAVLATDFRSLHPGDETVLDHAIGLAIDRVEPNRPEEIVMIDPWPGETPGARDRAPLSPALDGAHRAQKYSALIMYWTGWS
jgi:hypothetical protein